MQLESIKLIKTSRIWNKNFKISSYLLKFELK